MTLEIAIVFAVILAALALFITEKFPVDQVALAIPVVFLLTGVLDPHSRFMDPDEYGKLKIETEGNEEIDGIGIDVEKRRARLVIISPIEGSPAARAGIEPGDVIKRVDGVDVAPLEFDDAVARMQGPPEGCADSGFS